MIDRNRIKNHFRRQAQLRRRQRRGVLLLVVLSMLVLFMLIGTTFLLTSKHNLSGAKSLSNLQRVDNKPVDLLERALKQVLRDTQNPHSVARYHSLLRDMYGADGFHAVVSSDTTYPLLTPQYAGTVQFGGNIATDLGPTSGQLIDLIMTEVPTPQPPPANFVPDLGHVLKLETDLNGRPQDHVMPFTDGYYNGSILTILSGAAVGQSTRIVSFEYLSDNPEVLQVLGNPANPPRLWRLRVMAFAKADGTPLTMPHDLLGAQFIVNGRPFNGTGVGYNPLANLGGARLSAAEAMPFPNPVEYMEVALAPNAVFHNPNAIYGNALGTQLPNYPFQGAGDTDESYDAADFQNMYLALLSTMPRARGRVMDLVNAPSNPALGPNIYDVDDPQAQSLMSRFDHCSPNIDDIPLPSFHRPDLAHYWFIRMFTAPWLVNAISDPQARTLAILRPYAPDTNGNLAPNPQVSGLTPPLAAQITAIKRKFMLRPLPEDHPNFDGSNPISRYTNGSVTPWEVVGPWDVDNDNDGIPDSIWIDLGDPIQETADGKLYKPLYAFLIVDLDSKLNLNAHGTGEHLASVQLDATAFQSGNTVGNLAGGGSSNFIATGNSWGPAEISLRPVLSPQIPQAQQGNRLIDDYARLLSGRPNQRLDHNANVVADSFVAWGRYGSDDTAAATGLFTPAPGLVFSQPGVTLNPSIILPINPTRDRHSWYEFFGMGYPEFSNSAYSVFGHLPDLRGRYAVALDYKGQPVYESAYESTPMRMVDDSPYEMNLGEEHRNDKVSDPMAMADNYTSAGPVHDDAPFAIAELERILRAFDTDTGALPSRLWDVVDAFDPLKLQLTTSYISSFSDPTALLAQAQIDAAINRRLVTTDSWDVPAPAGNMYTRCLYGADGMPGVPGRTNVLNGETFANGCDDYRVVMGVDPPASAGIVDYARYRIFLEIRRQEFRRDPSSALANLQLDAPADIALATRVTVRVNAILRGGTWTDLNNNNIVHHEVGIFPPEILAGLKMDLNRPFGDGVDNNNNGVVDEAQEAGEPYYDANGNGIYDNGEPFLDLDLNGVYTQPLDRAIVSAQAGTTGPFDYGHFSNGAAQYVDGNTARQRFARYLYVLALLTMDENYVAPYDEDNPQIRTWIDKLKADLENDSLVIAEATRQGVAPDVWAEHIARKKLTFREIAQWAINCVEMRDSDVIMTPFEYDENPWDGWNVFHIDTSQNKLIVLPLDGDPATDENLGQYIDWPAATNNGNVRVTANLINNEVPTFAVRTRGLVWGTERPELLITETLGLHDRRTENLQSVNSQGHNTLNTEDAGNNKWNDDDLDQRHRPRGLAFVEVYNPWSSDGQRPAELYSYQQRDQNGNITTTVPSEGVELGRVSDVQSADGRRSPVWKIIVVEEHPQYRNDDEMDDRRFDVRVQPGLPAPPSPALFRPSDPDFPGFDYSFKPTRANNVTRVTGQHTYKSKAPANWAYDRNLFNITYPYVEREFYFTSNGTRTIDTFPGRSSVAYRNTPARYDVADAQSKLRIPIRSIVYNMGGQNGVRVAQTQRFIHHRAEVFTDPSRQIAPIVPGSYGVIGSAGAEFNPGIFSAIISRAVADSESTNGSGDRFTPTAARRVELQVGRNQLLQLLNRNPAANQVSVLSNGGKLGAVRDNEMISGTESNGFYGPAVAIPVDGMNFSEPPWEYGAREFEMATKDAPPGQGAAGNTALRFWPNLAKGEGMYGTSQGNPDSFDTPFDDAPELLRTGTTLNYRMVHLQRLANPMLLWNPPQYRSDGTADPEFRPELPVNPYLTVDSSSADLTAYNGISSAEGDQTDTLQADRFQLRPWVSDQQEVANYRRGGTPGRRGQWMMFRSHERGSLAARSTLKGPVANSLPTRAIWQQEPAKSVYSTDYYLDLLPWIDPTSAEADNRIQSRRTTFAGQLWPNPGPNDPPPKHMDMILEHSLGFGNESIGRILSTQNGSPAVIGTTYTTALGAPAPEAGVNTLNTQSTYPWLAWNNRPFSSDMELLQVPSRGSSELLRNYSVTNRYGTANPYDGNIPAPMTTPTPVQINDLRDANHRGHFGHLLNFFEAALFPADVQRDNTGAPVLDTTTADTKVIPIGAPHYYRLLDYLHVPTKFVGKDTLLNPGIFNRLGPDLTFNTADDVNNLLDPRHSLLAPFNRVAKYREPGRVNMNTVMDARVWDGGVLHRQLTFPLLPHHPVTNPYVANTGHLGLPYRAYDLTPAGGKAAPGLADIRRGYTVSNLAAPAVLYGSAVNFDPVFSLDSQFPTIFANPFRSGDAGDLVPLTNMVQQGGVHATLLRGTNITDPVSGTSTTDVSFSDQAPRSDNPEFDVSRNPYMKYAALHRAGSSATTRSNVFAIWVTVGFFEVERVVWQTQPNDPPAIQQAAQATRNRFVNNRALFDRVYPEGYAIAQEIGTDTGDVKRHRAFYIIDRTLPVGFKPGEDINVENIIKLRRRIE